MDGWKYVEREVVTDPKGRRWSVALMDILGQEGDAAEPSAQLALQYASGRYFTLIYSETGTLQWERGHLGLGEARQVFGRLVAGVSMGRLDPAQPTFREDLED
jgi:hypothetical protein